ncbi:MAG: acetyl-CoA C-acyltransferase [Flavobacteriales bacterium CG03_land_8_20_14_0_80_35_15]|nr:acetyl-CoA C-acyltransferase [Zetaproteobacteria bacterium]NDK17401.1 acetyl-CoA C-acyltransferase [Flavobacteriales bacterium]PIV17326.1 MAG: acetyl-CoA C-acyltransferase [Flavobacteriales bacterium CG03_land_8_20_14_0_80_35_15]PIX07160.1 MAG: acetyl-CoA C-acyltransferase [Flavobacteriales bacterium CG_4_8_14_3_um_filter_35_10]PJA04542.1 MAG: acetyl-CoA C-acyltransferase [Flavobacteriales bacterium CG_4_10_14_0_2_um_filter_35_18]
MNKKVVIVSAVRTPIGGMLGSLSSISATKLGAIAIKGALDKINLDPKLVDEVYMGQVVQANAGQAPAKQAALFAGLPNTIPCTTVNKVCASGMKAIMFAAQSIALGDADIVVAGGMESMSQIPHYLDMRNGQKLGNATLIDGLLKDGLVNVYDEKHMGTCGDLCASTHHFTREDQDQFAINSYTLAAKAWKEGNFNEEIIPVLVPQRKGDPIIVDKDEEFTKVSFDKIKLLKPAFGKDGTITAANASSLSDGAAALILMSEEKALSLGLKPLASIISYADASQAPEWFTTSPSKAIPKALAKANLKIQDVDYFEFNEAFAVVGLANTKILGIDASKVNVNGGAVALGHPLGCSGARIVVTLINVLKQNNGKIGAASICNGGGGAGAILIENR